MATLFFRSPLGNALRRYTQYFPTPNSTSLDASIEVFRTAVTLIPSAEGDGISNLDTSLYQRPIGWHSDSAPIPRRHTDGRLLVDWTTNDDAHPQNFSLATKSFVAAQIYIYTFTVYMGGAIFAGSEEGVMEEFGVGRVVAGLGFALYLLGYGMGPMFFSPISEIPAVGRNPPYIISMTIFVALCIPTALCSNFSGLLVLRFLQGFFGSPCLATGGATLQDMFPLPKLPYALMLWAWAMTCGPALAPIISGYSIPAKNWRWSLWEILWLAGPVLLVMLAFLPETSHSTILLQRAHSLRETLKTDIIVSEGEIEQESMNWSKVAKDALIRPFKMMILDPVVLYVDIYSSLCYAIFYSFFESFPFIYGDQYGFSSGEQGLAFLTVAIGTLLAGIWYIIYNRKVVEPRLAQSKDFAPENRLTLALYSTPLMPVGLFIFAWTGNGEIHWAVSMIGVVLNTLGLIVMYQCVFMYLPLAYPRYAASLLAGNDLARSALAGAAVIFSRIMFANLGPAVGVSLLGALTAALTPGIFGLYFFGSRLRAKSRFAEA